MTTKNLVRLAIFIIWALFQTTVQGATFLFEAENVAKASAFQIMDDKLASKGRCVVARSSNASGKPLSFAFELKKESQVRVVVEIRRFPGPGETPAQEIYDRSLRVRFDNGPWIDWTLENLGHLLWNWNSHDYPAWAGFRDKKPEWVRRFGPNPLWKNKLGKGKHRLQIQAAPHAEGVGIDRVVITTDMSYRPACTEQKRGVFFRDGFETDLSNWLWETVSGGHTEISTKHARLGRSSTRIELNFGEVNFKGDRTHREELMLHALASRGSERWVSFSLYLPGPKDGDEAWGKDSKNNDVVFQVHAFPDPDDPWAVPPISMNSSNGDWMIFLATDGDTSLADRKYDFIGPVWRAPYRTGVWTDWIYHFRFDHNKMNPKGFIQVWKDGRKILDKRNVQIGQNDVGAANIKTGIYKTNWRRARNAKTDVKRRVIYVDEFRVGDAGATFTQMLIRKKPTTAEVTGSRLPIVRQSDIKLETTFQSHHPLKHLFAYNEGRDFKKQTIHDTSSTLMNDVDERFQWQSGKGETKGEIRFDFKHPQTIDALVLWPYPSFDAVLTWPFARSADQQMHGGRADPQAGIRSIKNFRVTLLNARDEKVYVSPLFTARTAPSDRRIQSQVFSFGKACTGVTSAIMLVESNHGGLRTGASAIAFRVSSRTQEGLSIPLDAAGEPGASEIVQHGIVQSSQDANGGGG